VPLLGNRREIRRDAAPALAVIVAAKNFAAGRAAEDRADAVRFLQAKGAELVL